MILKSITLNGFKSFGKKVTIDVTHNVTGVVGPNGSGKSNVAEAIRFVLGEQSMKSMRSKASSDLIFKGSNGLTALNRASVEIKIDNSQKLIDTNVSHDLATYLDYDEIKLGREIYTDGESKYKINDATVRLRDVAELLALAGIGNSAHTIISQGEADRVLLANPKDRREIMEDALGLRVYHLRIKESEKKLLKVAEHKKDIDIIKREIRPQLLELGRSVRIIESRKFEINKLEKEIIYYVARESTSIDKRKSELDHTMGQGVDDRYSSVNNREALQNKYNTLKSLLDNDDREHELKLKLNSRENEYNQINNNLNKIKSERDVLMRVQIDTHKIGKDNNTFDGKSEDIKNKIEELISFDKSIIDKSKIDIDNKLDNAIYNAVHNNNAGVISNIGDAKSVLDSIFGTNSRRAKKVQVESMPDYSDEIHDLDIAINSMTSQNIISLEDLSKAKRELEDQRTNKYEMMKEISIIEKRIKEIEYTQKLNQDEYQRLKDRENNINVMLAEGVSIIGQSLILNKNKLLNNNGVLENGIEDTYEKSLVNMSMNDLLRNIEKSKIKIESADVADPIGVMKQYEDLNERDQFLNKELADIDNTENELKGLIKDLRVTLRSDFLKGIEKISFVFNNYFHEVFSGGKAKLCLVPTRQISDTQSSGTLSYGEGRGEARMDTNISDESGEEELIIDVSLPEKKVKDLHMLSGGERSLVSIALIFAMSSISPPPFIVLDETDAALDEINAKRYGQMLDKLAEKSKLLVITHNRATMNECDALYGVTIGSDGASRILSIKFEK